MAKYLVLENQQNPDGEILRGCDTEEQARTIFYQTCADAVTSAVETHSVLLLTGVGQQLDRAVFKHDAPET